MPIGTAGELYIGGVQVGRGYLNRPELTAERFIDDPFSGVPDARLYKTGDLARYLPDGNIEFLGRADFQVKIRGFRVELGEIEAALEAIAGVRQAIVVARERSGGDLELVAYVSSSNGDGPTTEDLRAQLLARLPAYMVPDHVRHDRPVPPEPERQGRSEGPPRAAACPPRARARRTPRRDPSSSAWSPTSGNDILEIEAVGVHDRFFELGGTSLQAARFVNEMQAELEESIFVVTLFTAPSVAEYAAFLRGAVPGGRGPPASARTTSDGPAAPSHSADLGGRRRSPAVPSAPHRGRDRSHGDGDGTRRRSSS